MSEIPGDSGAGAVRLPVWRTAAASYRFLARHPRDLVRIGWLPLLALIVLNHVFGTFEPVPEPAGPHAEMRRVVPMMGKAVANLLIQSAVAAITLVVWHRLVMLGQGAAGQRIPVRIGLRELRYLGAWMLISLVFLILMMLVDLGIILAFFIGMVAVQAVMMFTGGGAGMALGGQDELLTLVGWLGMPVAVVVAIYFTIRMSLVLPATATGKRAGFGHAWSVSSGNGARMVAASLLVMAPIQLAVMGLTEAARATAGSWPFHPIVILASIGFLLFILATGTVLSLFSLGLDRAPARDRPGEAAGADA
ncbi:MAG: hypothetical protein JSU82_18540 [Rhodospirillales bacterium]|nr:MAG: hypothetical protein JSU82_18540 [Rhodospirillales bacterium]